MKIGLRKKQKENENAKSVADLVACCHSHIHYFFSIPKTHKTLTRKPKPIVWHVD